MGQVYREEVVQAKQKARIKKNARERLRSRFRRITSRINRMERLMDEGLSFDGQFKMLAHHPEIIFGNIGRQQRLLLSAFREISISEIDPKAFPKTRCSKSTASSGKQKSPVA